MNTTSLLRTSALAITLAALPGAALAQTTPAGNTPQAAAETDESGDIVVTATRRDETLQRVPFSIAAQTEAQLRRLGATNVVELARNVAGLTVADLGPGQSQVAIRGVSSGQVVRDETSRKESVGVYLDDSGISLALFTPDLELFDLARVEVLRGPQGTLFGSGSLGGTLRYITNQPDLTRIEGSAQLEGSSIAHGGQGYAASGAINLPIVRDVAAIRAVGYYRQFGGFIDTIGQDGSRHLDVNDGERYGGRVALTVQPSSSISLTPRLVYQRLKTNGFPRADVFNIFRNPFTTTRPAGTFGPYEQFRQSSEGLDDRFLLADFKAEFDLGGATLTSVTSYTDRKVVVLRDSAQLTGQITGVAVGITAATTLNAPLTDTTNSKVFTQEVRLASDGDGPLQYVFGGYYYHQKKRYGQILSVPGFSALFNAATGATLDGRASQPVTGAPDILYATDFDIRVRQLAGFGEATYDLTEQLHATAGVRYFDYKEDRNAIQSGFFNCGSSLTDCSTPAAIRARKTSSHGFNPRFILAYDVAPRVTLNAQASKGFRLGGINDPLIANICQSDIAALGGRDIERFSDEGAWNYEAGIKSRFGPLTFNASAFYVDIKNLQVSARLRCSSTITVNVPRAETKGMELELSVRPASFLSAAFNVSYQNSRVLSTVNVPEPALGQSPVGPLIRRGDQLPTSPAWQASANATIEQPLGQDTTIYGSGVVQMVGDSYSFLPDQRFGSTLPLDVRFGRPAGNSLRVSYQTRLDGYALANFRIGVRSSAGWDASIFLNNAFDERAELALDRERGGEGRVAYIINQPRTIGAQLRYDF